MHEQMNQELDSPSFLRLSSGTYVRHEHEKSCTKKKGCVERSRVVFRLHMYTRVRFIEHIKKIENA